MVNHNNSSSSEVNIELLIHKLFDECEKEIILNILHNTDMRDLTEKMLQYIKEVANDGN